MRSIRIKDDQLSQYKLTRHRHLLLDLIRNANGHIDAKELYRRASDKNGSISLATVYRAIHLFKEKGLISERRLGRIRCSYELKLSDEHQHLLCKGCGKVTEFNNPLIKELINEVEQQHAFHVTRAELYLEGYCEGCDKESR